MTQQSGKVFNNTKIQFTFLKPSVVTIVGLFLLVVPFKLKAQNAIKKDTTIILLSDFRVQLECTQALNDLYNFKFDNAEAKFRSLKTEYGWHPLPYFLMGLIEWWKIMPNTSDKSHDDTFLVYMDSTINVAERLYDDYPANKVEAAFFLAAAYGFKGRLYSDEERKQWRKAASAGKDALAYLDESRGYHNLSPELLFGDALYNYFSVWVPENYPALKPVLWFFRKGDKALGLKQLKEVSYNAFYTRIEAMVWLMRILNSYENDQLQAFQISKYLNENYPDNPFFHRYYARMLYSMGRFGEAEMVCKDILARIDNGMLGYEATSGRYAAFFLGQIYENRKNLEESKKYYKQCLAFAEQIDATDSGYYLYSLISLGEIAEKQGDKAEARKYFKQVKENANRKDEAFKDAKKRLKKLEKGD
ncbi:tetratricopeptide repeat protein [Chryseosolibacter indicus]|uniref:Tetratricopeptide repeat protein n=1 Tax=Chryseosolibacter indicus TaxID=2782351 RepID=A0ABS5VLZ1_9BACT|nr:tetratricopeptide repeat protein [Chryseosolibacter indicus]MBT1702023.1 tetratricopeptide repeat protein [Chryseosolibacter indicus]